MNQCLLVARLRSRPLWFSLVWLTQKNHAAFQAAHNKVKLYLEIAIGQKNQLAISMINSNVQHLWNKRFFRIVKQVSCVVLIWSCWFHQQKFQIAESDTRFHDSIRTVCAATQWIISYLKYNILYDLWYFQYGFLTWQYLLSFRHMANWTLQSIDFLVGL